MKSSNSTGTADHDPEFAREATLLAEAQAEIDSGMEMDEAEVEAWLDALDSDQILPIPKLRPAATPKN